MFAKRRCGVRRINALKWRGTHLEVPKGWGGGCRPGRGKKGDTKHGTTLPLEKNCYRGGNTKYGYGRGTGRGAGRKKTLGLRAEDAPATRRNRSERGGIWPKTTARRKSRRRRISAGRKKHKREGEAPSWARGPAGKIQKKSSPAGEKASGGDEFPHEKVISSYNETSNALRKERRGSLGNETQKKKGDCLSKRRNHNPFPNSLTRRPAQKKKKGKRPQGPSPDVSKGYGAKRRRSSIRERQGGGGER